MSSRQLGDLFVSLLLVLLTSHAKVMLTPDPKPCRMSPRCSASSVVQGSSRMRRSSHYRCLRLLRRRRTMTRTSPVQPSRSPPTSAAAVLRMLLLLRVLRRWAAMKSRLTGRQAGDAPVCADGRGRGGELNICTGERPTLPSPSVLLRRREWMSSAPARGEGRGGGCTYRITEERPTLPSP